MIKKTAMVAALTAIAITATPVGASASQPNQGSCMSYDSSQGAVAPGRIGIGPLLPDEGASHVPSVGFDFWGCAMSQAPA